MEENEREVKTHSENRVWSWGAGTDGQLASEILQDSNFPQPLPSLQFTANPISHIACGGAHVIALCKDNGKVLTWGRGTSGQLGHGDTKNCLHPLPVHKLENLVISNVSAGWNHSGFVSNTGRIFTCGDGSFGQLGHGDDQSQYLPREVLSLGSKDVELVACGMRHTLVLLKEDQIYGFGSGNRGQLGSLLDKTKRSSNLPQLILGFEGIEITSISANGDQSAALTVDGQLYTWGKGYNDNKTDTPYLLQSSLPSRYTKLALGWNHALLLSGCGKVFMLGGKRHGMLSDPQKKSLSRGVSLVEVSGLDNVKVVDIAAGSEHSALVTENGTIMTWGWGEHGQLGLGNEEDQTTPQIVSLGVDHSNTGTRFNIYCGSGFTFAIAKASAESPL
ncbi:HECT-type E3 ubiquitin transferase [Ranunculus cassubicifolius]